MTDFYRDLSSAALADDDSDVSEPDLNKMIADMDDLDANLFGTSAVKSSSVVPTPKPPKLQASSLYQSLDSDRPASKQPAKSRLLAELFGDSDTYSPSTDMSVRPPMTRTDISGRPPTSRTDMSVRPPTSLTDMSMRPPTSRTDMSGRPPTSRTDMSVRPPTSRTDTFDLTSPRPTRDDTYRPTSEPRERRRQATSVATAEDMWSKFLQPSDTEPVLKPDKEPSTDLWSKFQEPSSVEPVFTNPEKIQEPPDMWSKFLQPSGPEPVLQKHDNVKEPPSESRMKVELSPVRSRSPAQSPARLSPVKSAEPSPLSAEDLLSLLRPQLEEMITEQVEVLHSAHLQSSADLEDQISQLSNSNINLQRTQEELQATIEQQQRSLKDLQHKTDSEVRAWQERLDTLTEEHRSALAAAQEQSSQQITALHGQVTQLQRRVQEGHDQLVASQTEVEGSVAKSFRLASQQLSSALSTLRSEVCDDLRATQAQLDEVERRCAEEQGKWGAELGRLQTKLSASRRPWEEDLEMRVEQTENILGARLLHANRQQARLGAWQEKQLSDLAEYLDQRLWSLYHQQKRELSQPCSEAASLRRIVSQQEKVAGEREVALRALETRVCKTESEVCRLGRLAERLCGVLAMWEQRHKGAARVEEESLQSLRERFNLALIERGNN